VSLVAAFQTTPAGQGVTFSQSFAASGMQASDVVSGLLADLVNSSTTLDMTKPVIAGLVAKTWADLIKPGIQVVTPNPFSSGSAKWNLPAGQGDVLLDYQDVAQYAVGQGEPITVVTPLQSIAWLQVNTRFFDPVPVRSRSRSGPGLWPR